MGERGWSGLSGTSEWKKIALIKREDPFTFHKKKYVKIKEGFDYSAFNEIKFNPQAISFIENKEIDPKFITFNTFIENMLALQTNKPETFLLLGVIFNNFDNWPPTLGGLDSSPHNFPTRRLENRWTLEATDWVLYLEKLFLGYSRFFEKPKEQKTYRIFVKKQKKTQKKK